MTRAGDVLFFRGASPISKLISWFTKSPYTHVALALGDGRIIESDRFVNTRIRHLTDEDVFDIHRLHDATPESLNLACMVAQSFEGARYDYLQIAGIAVRLLFRWDKTLFNRANYFICSELIDVSFMASYIERLHQSYIGSLDPGQLLQAYDLRKVESESFSTSIQVIQ